MGARSPSFASARAGGGHRARQRPESATATPRRTALAYLAVAAGGVCACGEEAAQRVPAARELAPDFDLTLFDGGRFRLSEQGGKAVVLNFFASWCVSCGEEAPVLDRATRQFAPKGVVFVAIAVDDTETKARSFLAKVNWDVPAGLDRSGKVKQAYGIYGMPMTFFIDKSRRLSYVHAGTVTRELLEHEIGKLL